jgi:hypothetical protein
MESPNMPQANQCTVISHSPHYTLSLESRRHSHDDQSNSPILYRTMTMSSCASSTSLPLDVLRVQHREVPHPYFLAPRALAFPILSVHCANGIKSRCFLLCGHVLSRSKIPLLYSGPFRICLSVCLPCQILAITQHWRRQRVIFAGPSITVLNATRSRQIRPNGVHKRVDFFLGSEEQLARLRSSGVVSSSSRYARLPMPIYMQPLSFFVCSPSSTSSRLYHYREQHGTILVPSRPALVGTRHPLPSLLEPYERGPRFPPHAS